MMAELREIAAILRKFRRFMGNILSYAGEIDCLGIISIRILE